MPGHLARIRPADDGEQDALDVGDSSMGVWGTPHTPGKRATVPPDLLDRDAPS